MIEAAAWTILRIPKGRSFAGNSNPSRVAICALIAPSLQPQKKLITKANQVNLWISLNTNVDVAQQTMITKRPSKLFWVPKWSTSCPSKKEPAISPNPKAIIAMSGQKNYAYSSPPWTLIVSPIRFTNMLEFIARVAPVQNISGYNIIIRLSAISLNMAIVLVLNEVSSCFFSRFSNSTSSIVTSSPSFNTYFSNLTGFCKNKKRIAERIAIPVIVTK